MTRFSNKCLFLDRDGIINKDVGYAYRPDQIDFIPDIFKLCRRFQQSGYKIIVVTNQSGIARSYYTEMDLYRLNQWMKKRFQEQGIIIDAIYHCPHHPKITGPCVCRKPQ